MRKDVDLIHAYSPLGAGVSLYWSCVGVVNRLKTEIDVFIRRQDAVVQFD